MFGQPERLKYLLAPIVCKDAQAQQQFYSVFERYLQELRAPAEWPISEESASIADSVQKPPFNRWLILPAVLGLLLLGGVFIYYASRPAVPEPALYFEIANTPIVGDTLHLRNRSGLDTSRFRFDWALLDSAGTPIERVRDQVHWSVVLSAREKQIVQLTAADGGGDRIVARIDSMISVRCAAPPRVAAIQVSADRVGMGEAIAFSVATNRPDAAYLWRFGDGASSRRAVPEHQYEREGNYRVSVEVEVPGAQGLCKADTFSYIQVGEEKAYLLPLPLQKDAVTPVAAFHTGSWLLLGGLAALTVFLWWRWWQQASKPEAATHMPEEAARFQVTDRAPYFIPFQPKDDRIRQTADQLRVADRLRLRQLSTQQQVDVAKSIEATIDSGGFPELRFRYGSKPPEYLVLIDEQSRSSHQARLFGYLAKSLQQREVFIDLFYYQDAFFRFWNHQHPGGISLDQLHGQYPTHRLLIMGDGHALLNPFALGRVAPRLEQAAVLRRWKRRVLITPLLPATWDYREKALYELLPVFPSDIRGLLAAAALLETDEEEASDRPAFTEWRAAQRSRADLPAHHWQTLAQHRAYLADYPAVFTWWCALAVYPQPTWELTIAIGTALAPLGVEVTYDQLLLLARIPWLRREQAIPRKLRREMLAALPPEATHLARTAVQRELLAVAADAKDGYANLELQINLAIQEFALYPHRAEQQASIRYLLAENQLNKRQRAELDAIVRQLPGQPPENAEAFLQQRPTSSGRSYRYPSFRWALAASLLVLSALLMMLTYGQTDRLYEWAFGEVPAADRAHLDRPLQSNFFVREQLTADSAILYNNEAVAIWQRDTNLTALPPLERALVLRPDYALARENAARLLYNSGQLRYGAGIDSAMVRADTLLPLARTDFQAALQYQPRFADALHGLGLSHFYPNRQATDSAKIYYDAIRDIDSAYFDTLQQQPNLETLLNQEAPAPNPAAEPPTPEPDLPAANPVVYPKKGTATLKGQSYQTIQFEANGLTWLAENLNYEVSDSWCYDEDPANCQEYGRLYTWSAAKQACAALGDGWRLPTDAEWRSLAESFGGYYEFETGKNVGGNLQKAYEALLEGGSSGFSARLGGRRFSYGSFDFLGRLGDYWSATERVSGYAWYCDFRSYYEELYRLSSNKSAGLSCRCIQD